MNRPIEDKISKMTGEQYMSYKHSEALDLMQDLANERWDYIQELEKELKELRGWKEAEIFSESTYQRIKAQCERT